MIFHCSYLGRLCKDPGGSEDQTSWTKIKRTENFFDGFKEVPTDEPLSEITKTNTTRNVV